VVAEIVHTTEDDIVEIEPEKSEDGTSASVTVGAVSMQTVADKNLKLHLKSDLLELLFDDTAVKDILTDYSGKSSITLVVEDKTEAESGKLLFDIYLSVDGETQASSDFGEGVVTVTIPLAKLNLTEKQTVEVWHVERDADGKETKRTKMEDGFTHDRDKGHVSFNTNHFSDYEVVVVNEAVEEPTIAVEVKPTAGTNGTTVSAALDGTTLTVSNTDSARAYVYLVKYTIDGTTFVNATKNADGTFAIPEGATKVTVESALLGDVNLNGKVNNSDAYDVLDIYANKKDISELQRLAGDVNFNNKFNNSDAFDILHYYANKVWPA
jgi:hypothetical protein